MSVRSLKHAKEEGGDFKAVVVRYVLERLLYWSANSLHSSEVVLKGAFLFVIWLGRRHRVAKDTDLLSYGTPDLRHLGLVFRDVRAQIVPEEEAGSEASTVVAKAIREEALCDGSGLRSVAPFFLRNLLV